ncbi:MAG: T9SS type A sorting domain-containing protein [Sphingobacteriales bacterium JAD_PAG50586_3]|nr:MAG: T9SS type A sorting domain-containing protein [Sphingobacteriales bacterium JAD_PAG50586_3]
MAKANTDFGTLRYSIDGGTNWTDINTNYQSTSSWTCATVTLPVECENITNLKIGYRWRNNNTGGNDPPFNIDNVLVRADGGGGGGSGCTGSTTFTITQPAAALTVATTAQTNVACFGGSTGSVTVAGTGGTTNYQYKIGNGPLQGSGTFSGLAAGTYTITVQDANNCTSTVQATITGPSAALTGSITSQTQTGCGTSTGSVTVAGAGGITGYQYKIGNGPLQGSGTFSGLAAGSYTVTVQDANGCTATVPVTITSPSGLTLSSTNQTNVLCFGASTGSVTVAGANGTPNYQYKIGNGPLQGSGTFTGLAAGTYVITVQDGANCTTTLNVTITGPSAALSVAGTNQTNVLCFGNSTGSVTVAGSGGTPNYQYKIGNGPLQGSGTFNGLAAGTYTITVQDGNNCTSTVPVTITGPSAALAGSISTQTPATCGSNNGGVTVTASGGTANYQYKIDNGPLQPTGVFTGLSAGPHTVTVQDANGCTTTVSATITSPSAVTATVNNADNVSCNGAGDGEMDITGSGGTPNYTYSLDGTTYQGSGNFTGLDAGSYIVYVKDNSGCIDTAQVNITEPAPVVVTTTPSGSTTLCEGQQLTLTVSSQGTTACQWSNGGNGSSINVSQDGTYSVTCQDVNGCEGTSANVIVSISPLPIASFNSEQIDNFNVEFTSASINGSSYLWTFPGGNTSADENPTFNFPLEGNYNVTLIVTNACGSDTLTQIIGVDKITGVEELGVLSTFNLYPNPANGEATIKMEAAKPVKATLSILTVDGRMVFGDSISFNNNYSTTIDLSKLAAGIYIVNLVADDIYINRKLIIQK